MSRDDEGAYGLALVLRALELSLDLVRSDGPSPPAIPPPVRRRMRELVRELAVALGDGAGAPST